MAAEHSSIDAIKAFQASHKNHLGKPLKVDGDLGPQTRWAMDLETLCPERRAIVRAAQQHIGLIENPPGSNSDPRGLIQGWLKACGARAGDPWCAAYASFALGIVGAEMPRIASAQQLGRAFPQTMNPVAGDVGWYPTDARHGHVFVIIGVTPIGFPLPQVMTIEGNSNNCVRCIRRPFHGLSFGRTIADTTGRCPGIIERDDVPLTLRSVYGTR